MEGGAFSCLPDGLRPWRNHSTSAAAAATQAWGTSCSPSTAAGGRTQRAGREVFGKVIEPLGANQIGQLLMDFDRELYGEKIRVRFLHRLRGEKKFESIDALRSQIDIDYCRAVRYFQRPVVRRNLEI